MLYEVITSDVAITRGKRVIFYSSKGEVRGVIGNTAIHLRRDHSGEEKAPKWHEICIDIGANSKADRITSYNVCYTKLLRHFAKSLQFETSSQRQTIHANAYQKKILRLQ